MSAKKISNRFMLYVVLFAVSLFLIFFVGKSINKETGETNTIITSNGLLHFKKGLDIAGGVRLTYKIDFSKYEDVYANETELLQVKKTAQDIILKNIDERISKLGVSDYSAYVQKLSDGEYLIVEIGGLSDIDEAKGIIGKTVELEFKLANDDNQGSAALYAQRQEVAENLLVNVSANPDQFEQLGSGKVGDDIFYTHYEDAAIEQLPDIYRNNPQLLSSLQTGKVYPTLLTDVYHVLQAEDASGAVQTQTLKGFTMVKYNGASSVKLDAIEPARVAAVAELNNLNSEIIWRKNITPAPLGSLTYENGTLTYAGPESLPGMSGYNIELYQVVATENMDAIVAKVTNNTEPTASEATLMVEGWADGTVLGSQFVGFDPSQAVKLYQQPEGNFILKITDSKQPSDTLVPTFVFNGLSQQRADALRNEITNATLYDIEDIRVQDTQTWIPAQDPKSNDILNGAFFKFANVSQSQTGLPVVAINFDDKGKEIFCNITSENIGKQMAIFVG